MTRWEQATVLFGTQAMSRLFNRNYELIVTASNGEILIYRPPMEMKFSITNYPNNTLAISQISIYGISARARDVIQIRGENGKGYGKVTLKAGYGDDLGVIFDGRINSVQVAKDGVSTYISLFCSNITSSWDNASFQAWGEGTPYIEVLRDLAANFGLPVEVVGDFSDLPRLPVGCNGGGQLCRDLLNSLKQHFRFDWMITPSKTILSRHGIAREGISYELSSMNGMAGVPRWYTDSMEVDIKLNYRIQPLDIVNILSDFWTLNFSGAYFTDLNDLAHMQLKTGKFNVLKTRHEGALSGDIWNTTVICQWRGK
ncbi:hypothetical protein [Serratia aquatilis]|uniref:Uncharacterized protein n=1 Tax=Serratia aquatilis TaxID=1737515 RepID=A0ABV6EEH8_9GAMM